MAGIAGTVAGLGIVGTVTDKLDMAEMGLEMAGVDMKRMAPPSVSVVQRRIYLCLVNYRILTGYNFSMCSNV